MICLFAACLVSGYLNAVDMAVSAYTPERITNYIARVEERGIWEHGFPRLAANLATLVAKGRAPDKRDLLKRLMDLCAREMPRAHQRNGFSAGNDFSVKEIVWAIRELEAAGTFPKAVTDGWRAVYSKMVAKDIYSEQPKVGDKLARNWCVFGAASEQARLNAGMGGDPAYVERYLSDQMRFFDRNGMYKDPHQPIVYDLVTRLQYGFALWNGYQGPSRTRLEELLLKSAEPTLAMQSVTGEIPYGGRSNQFWHNEGLYAALCEWYASWFKKRGDLPMASRFRRAAAKALASLERGVAEKPVRHVKNRYPTETGYGCEKYAYFDKYMVTTGSWFYLANLFADETIPVAEGDEPDSVFVTSDAFHRVMANCGDYTVQFDWKAQRGYDGNGLGRIHRRGAPSAICLSSPCPVKANYAMDVTNEETLAIAPVGWRSFKVTAAKPNRVTLTNGAAEWVTQIGPEGVTLALTGDGPQALTLPAFDFDGETRPDVACDGKTLTVSYRGWVCRYAAEKGTIVDTGVVAGNRNGHYRRFELRGDGAVAVRVTIGK